MHRAAAWRALAACGWATLLGVSPARAVNRDEVNAGIDVIMSGGAVAANVSTGAALWYNPAGLARWRGSSFQLSGSTLKTIVTRAPGLLSLSTGERSPGRLVDFSVIPEAASFEIDVGKLSLGVGLFNSSVGNRLAQLEVTRPATDNAGAVQWLASANTSATDYHISTGLAGRLAKLKRELLIGGSVDLLVSSRRSDSAFAGNYGGGAEGLFSESLLRISSGMGLQAKLGMQWLATPHFRIGLSVATPSYLFVVFENEASSGSMAPPGGSPDAPEGAGASVRRVRGTWLGSEPGNFRLGLAYLGDWGWVEADLVSDLRLRESIFSPRVRTVVNGRAAVVLELHPQVSLGLGGFTDFSSTKRLSQVGDNQIDLFGGNVGLLYATRPLMKDREGRHQRGERTVVVAMGLRYAAGRGETLGLEAPAVYDPAAIKTKPVSTRVQSIVINLGLNVSF